jgi:pimeloyl-ACP methyl ester carboxylesterase
MPWFSARGYHCHAVSLRGHGESEGKDRLRTTTLNEFMLDIRRAADACATPPVIIAHSMGALILRRLLEEWTPTAVILLCPYTREANSRWIRELLPKNLGRVFLTLLTATPYLLVSNHEIARKLFFSDDMPEEQARAFTAQLQNESFFAFMEMLRGMSLTPKQVDTPMLVVSAERDALFAPAGHQRLADRYKAEFCNLPDTAHDAMLDPRWEHAARCLLRWLTSLGL